MPTPTVAPGPCAAWVNAADISNYRPAVSDTISAPDVLELAAGAASDLLYVLSGRQFTGPCTATIRPTARPITMGLSEWAVYFESLTGGGFNSSWGRSGTGEAGQWYRHPPQIDLGVYPLNSVTVKIDGVTIPSTEYRIDDYRLLTRVRPTVNSTPTEHWGWPTVQDFTLPDTEQGTFSVTANYGMTPPKMGVMACATMAAELALAMSGEPNQLPERVTNLVRQGVSITMLDPMTFLKEGKTGIYQVDLFLQAYNPTQKQRRPRVFSPDLGYSRRPTG